MKKKIILGVSLFLMLLTLFALNICAAEPIETWDISATSSDNVTATLYDDYSLVISGTGKMKDWTFYSDVPWYSSYRNKIKSLTIEDGIITIGNWAFSNLTALISVEIASGVEIIGEDAFSGCDSLTSIEIPDSITLIGSGAFADCFLTSLIIPNSVICIGEDAFFNCRKLTSLVIPSSVLDIGDYAFDYCENLTIYTEFESQPSGWCSYWNDTDCPVVWGIDDFGCTSKGLVWVFFSDENIAMITGQINAVGNIIIPEKINEYVVTAINTNAFYGNASLNKVVLSNSVTTIGFGAFALCDYLTTVVIGNSVTTIGYSAFNSCDSLKSITIPSGVTSIDSLAFRGCTSLTIYAEATSQPSGWGSGWNPDNRPVVWGHTHTYEDYICVCGMEQSYIEKWDISATENDNVTATLYDDYSLVISGTGEMKNWTGSSSAPWHSLYSREIKSVTIEKGVINIGDYAFYWCIALERVVINDSVTRIGRGSFLVCAVLMSIEIPDSVTSIGEYAFDGCDALTSIDVDKNNEYYCSIDGNLYTKDLKTLVRYAMGKNDTSFEIPQGVETIGNYAISYCRALTNVVISNSVTSIGYDAFYGCNALISIEIPDSVTSIGDCAFYLCDALTSIRVSKNNEFYCSVDGNLYTKDLKTLVQYAIGKTDTSFEIPQGIETIGNHAFSYCRALTSVFIPDSVTTIGYYAFRNCSSLTIYAEATSQPSGWVSGWNPDNRPVVWGHTHTYEDYICVCGMEQSYIEKWDISATENDNVTATLYDDYSLVISGTGAMMDGISPYDVSWYYPYSSKIKSATIEEGVTTIGNYAFCRCTSLTSVVIGDSVTTIGNGAFRDCTSLTSVVIGSSVTTIGYDAFRNCTSLTSVAIGDSVTTIGSYAFAYCDLLTIYAEAKSKPSGWYSSWNYSNRPVVWGCYIDGWDVSVNDDESVMAYLNPIDNEEDYYILTITGTGKMKDWKYSYSSKAPWYSSYSSKIKSITIEEGVTNIGDYAFEGCTALTSVVIGDSVTDIGSYAFYGCSSLTSIEVSENNTAHCDIDGNLYTKDKKTLVQYATGKTDTSFVIPNGVTTISNYAFYSCDSLTSVVIPDSVTTIGNGAFRDCTSLTSVVIPDSVTTIGNYAFAYCDSLTSIAIPDSVTSIDHFAFAYCDSLTSVAIPSSVTTIGNYAFCNCGSLTSIKIPNSVTSIGDYAFQNCISLISVVIPNSVTAIGEGALSYCDSLTSIEVSENNEHYADVDGNLYTIDLKTLVQYAIGKKDTSFTILDSVTAIGNYAFAFCTSLTSVELPDGIINIGNRAFYFCNSLTSTVIPDSVTTIGNDAFHVRNSLTIYAEAASKPSGWSSYWNSSNRPVVWDYKNTIRGQVFTFKGYSFNEAGSMAVGFDIDYEAKALYEELTGETLEIGVVFAGYSLLNGNQPLDSQGNAITLPDGAVVKFDLTEYDYTYYDFVITDIIDGIKDIPLVISAYINNGAENKYIQENGISDTVSGISYNEANRK